MDFSDLPSGFIYNEHFRVVVLDSDGAELPLPNYFVVSNEIAPKDRQLQIRVMNMNPESKTFSFGIYLMHGLFAPYSE
jgi:hypothetical protein